MKYINKQYMKEYEKLAEEFELELIVLFGSYAKNEVQSYSDVDIAYFAKKPLNEYKKRELRNKFSNIFKDAPIDLIELNTNQSIFLRYEIFQTGICLFESKEDLYNEFENNSWFDYIDNKTYLDEYKDIVRKKIETL